jgi:hypothetical protein
MMGEKKVTSLFEILARDGGTREAIGIVHVVDQPFLRKPQFQVSQDGQQWSTIYTGGTNNKSGVTTYTLP